MNVEPARESTADLLLERVRATISARRVQLTADGLMTIFQIIVSEVETRKVKLCSTESFGIVFFLDRVLIHDVLFARFLGFDPSSVAAVLDSPAFNRMTVPRYQFEKLLTLHYIRGSWLDWHVYKYPFNNMTEELVALLHRVDGESLALAIEQPQQSPMPPPRLSLSRMDKFTVPPTNSKRLRVAEKSMEEVMAIFADEPPPGRCWLLYLDEKI